MTWLYNNTAFTTAPDEHLGFVYCITNTATNRRYIGKKLFWTTKKLPPLKGKKNRRHRRVETDWQNYWSSSESVKRDVAIHGENNFRRDILLFCANKNQLAYHETRLQFELGVLLSGDWYNDYIGCRVTGRGL